MKLKISVLTFLSVISALISATPIHVGKWQRPNGTSVTVVSDVHLPSKNELVQREDFIAHMKSINAPQLLAEDPCELGVPSEYCPSSFIPGIVKTVQAEHIPAQSIEFRTGRCGLDRNKMIAHIDFLRSKHAEVSAHIPETYKNVFAKISDQLNALKEESEDLKLMPLQEKLEMLELELTDYVFLSHVEDRSLQDKDLFVCVGADHGIFLEKAFDTFDYKQIKSIGDYNEDDLVENIDAYAINIKSALL